jgi:hypothetical protein
MAPFPTLADHWHFGQGASSTHTYGPRVGRDDARAAMRQVLMEEWTRTQNGHYGNAITLLDAGWDTAVVPLGNRIMSFVVIACSCPDMPGLEERQARDRQLQVP